MTTSSPEDPVPLPVEPRSEAEEDKAAQITAPASSTSPSDAPSASGLMDSSSAIASPESSLPGDASSAPLPLEEGSADNTPPAPSLLPPPLPRRTSTSSSSSKLHEAIQDIISQFDPLRGGGGGGIVPGSSGAAQTGGSATAEAQAMRSRFEPDTDGFNYNEFLQQLRQPAAKPVARTVKSFLADFVRRPMTLAEQVRFVHEFLDFIGDRMRAVDPWQTLDERGFENAREGMEKLVMNRLYAHCFTPAVADDADRDIVLREKMGLFRWIRPHHLDLPEAAATPQSTAFLDFARAELLKMNGFKAPRDKVICILNCCTVIYGLLRNMRGDGRDDVGADRFLPLLIYVVLTACPARLVSNIQYIMRFRSPERMQSEAGYYVTNLQGAVSFIESMDASCLSISQEEFDRNIEMTIWEMELEKRTQSQRPQRQQQQQQQQQSESQRLPQHDMPGERAQWLLDRSSDLAKSTLEKTNNFVGRLISEFSTPAASESGRSTPVAHRQPVLPPPTAATTTAAAAAAAIERPDSSSRYPGETLEPLPVPAATADQRPVVGGPEWTASLDMMRDMFPNIDREVVDIVFESNAGLVPRTIEQLLEMSTEADAVLPSETTEAERSVLSTTPAPASNIATASTSAGASTGTTTAGVAAAEEVADVVAEMEKWKGHWADDDASDDDESDSDSDTGISEVNPPAKSTEPPTTNAVPDTSGDEELARKLQHEYELQAAQSVSNTEVSNTTGDNATTSATANEH
ncbi:hypothetical protein GGI07_005235 [Coemansia sp. Benny D115]|nr:hypothetical protein GGI07_005235 [Coemansia sp. Benny D115]